MPLRDHFHPPLDELASWEELHGQWPAMIVLALMDRLPPNYAAAPRVHLGALFEVDVVTLERDRPSPAPGGPNRMTGASRRPSGRRPGRRCKP